MGGVDVVRAERPGEREEWDRAIEAGGGGLLLSTTVWAEILASSLGVAWSLLLCRIGDELVGGALLLDSGGRGGPPVGAPHPFFSLHVFSRGEAPSTKRIPEGVEVLSALARALAEKESGLVCATPPSLVDLRPLSWAGWRVEPRSGFSLRLPARPMDGEVRLEETRPSAGDALSSSCVEKGIGAHHAAIFARGGRASLLVLRDAARVYPLLLSPPGSQLSRRDRVALARAVGSLPDADGREEALFFGEAWEQWFGYESIEPLGFVPTARAVMRGGGG